MGIDERINSLDVSLFDHVESQTSIEDKRSLLALQSAARARGTYIYLEIGSYLGGSLQPHVADPLCERIISIDPRPQVTPDSRDEHGTAGEYGDTTTARMLELLSGVPGANLDKVVTIAASTEQIDPASLDVQPTLCFVDGEHTPQAALRDAIFCLKAGADATIAFHDRGTVRGALGAFLSSYGGYGFQLPEVIFVVERGLRLRQGLRSRVERPHLWDVMNRLRLAGPLMTGVSLVKRPS